MTYCVVAWPVNGILCSGIFYWIAMPIHNMSLNGNAITQSETKVKQKWNKVEQSETKVKQTETKVKQSETKWNKSETE